MMQQIGYLTAVLAVTALYLSPAAAQGGAGQLGTPRNKTCTIVAECLRTFAQIRSQERANYHDMEGDVIMALEALVAGNKGFNNNPKCSAAILRDYVNKHKRVQVLKADRLKRMEQCVTRVNTWGRGFEPCAMPLETAMPNTCSTPLDLWRHLFGMGAEKTTTGETRPVGRDGLWALLADPKNAGTTGIRTKRSAFKSNLDDPFQTVDACLKDTCGCPEIEMCDRCYQTHPTHREMVVLEQAMLTHRWNCGILLKNMK